MTGQKDAFLTHSRRRCSGRDCRNRVLTHQKRPRPQPSFAEWQKPAFRETLPCGHRCLPPLPCTHGLPVHAFQIAICRIAAPRMILSGRISRSIYLKSLPANSCAGTSSLSKSPAARAAIAHGVHSTSPSLGAYCRRNVPNQAESCPLSSKNSTGQPHGVGGSGNDKVAPSLPSTAAGTWPGRFADERKQLHLGRTARCRATRPMPAPAPPPETLQRASGPSY